MVLVLLVLVVRVWVVRKRWRVMRVRVVLLVVHTRLRLRMRVLRVMKLLLLLLLLLKHWQPQSRLPWRQARVRPARLLSRPLKVVVLRMLRLQQLRLMLPLLGPPLLLPSCVPLDHDFLLLLPPFVRPRPPHTRQQRRRRRRQMLLLPLLLQPSALLNIPRPRWGLVSRPKHEPLVVLLLRGQALVEANNHPCRVGRPSLRLLGVAVVGLVRWRASDWIGSVGRGGN